MTEELSEPRGTRRWWLIGLAVIVVAAVVWAVVAGVPGGSPAPGPVPSATPTAGQFTTPVPEPSVASPTATGTPTVEPTRKPSSVETGLDDDVETSPGVTASIERIEAVSGEARGPGEIAGPALRVTIKLTNGSDKAVRTELGLINVYYGKDRTPAGTLSGPGVTPFPAEIPAGGSGSGTSVFNVPTGQRGQIEVEFSYSTDVPVVLFSGAV
ncbi:MAG: hypothetical protein IT193_15185 [Propionibacteriaceae bacterium]|nr:hypothetical protein [Propionibacteriaceae bacterium]